MSRSCLLAWLMLSASAAASAVPFRLISDERSVASDGAAITFTDRTYYDGTPPESTVVQDIQVRQPLNYTPRTRTRSFGASDGMSLRTPNASVDGQGAQTSSFSGVSGIRFDGVADVLATAANDVDSGENYTEIRTGSASGSAESSARWTFALDSAQATTLSMTSNLSESDLSGFSFSLTANNGFAWTTPYLGSDDGLLFTFTTGLLLQPGVYTLDARLRAGVVDVQDASRGDRVTASFSLLAVGGIRGGFSAVGPASALAAPVPEPATAGLALAGLLMVWGVARVRRAGAPRGSVDQAVPPTVSRSSRNVG